MASLDLDLQTCPRNPARVCYVHVTESNQKLTPFTIRSWSTFLDCRSRWKNIDCFEGEFARKSITDNVYNVRPINVTTAEFTTAGNDNTSVYRFIY